MSSLPLTPISVFEFWRQEAKRLRDELDLPLNKAQDILAKQKGFNHWLQISDSHKLFLSKAEAYRTATILFFDVSDADSLSSQELELGLTRDDVSTLFCEELLWKKKRIHKSFQDRKEDLVGFTYTGSRLTLQRLFDKFSESLFSPPSYVFIDGCFLMFQELQELSDNNRAILKGEKTLVEYDRIDDLCEKFGGRYTCTLFDFSGDVDFGLPIQVGYVNAMNWSANKVIDHISDFRVDHVILYAPPKAIVESVRLVISDSMLDVLHPLK
jgi:hypothetical protein